MRRPDWVPAPAWARLDAVLRGPHAQDVLADLEALTAAWDASARARLLERFAWHAERGVALPVAVIRSLDHLVRGDG